MRDEINKIAGVSGFKYLNAVDFVRRDMDINESLYVSLAALEGASMSAERQSFQSILRALSHMVCQCSRCQLERKADPNHQPARVRQK